MGVARSTACPCHRMGVAGYAAGQWAVVGVCDV